jgi:CelD/BcsL family acetyltransferase involved in cellulose biosynthesis
MSASAAAEASSLGLQASGEAELRAQASGLGPQASGEAELRVEVVEGRDAFVQLERVWNDALARGPRDEPMLRHEWVRAFIENFAPGATLRTFVAKAGRELHAAVPLIETQERSADTCFLPMTTWSIPVNDHSQRGGILLGRRWEEGLSLIWQTLQQRAGWDRLRLRDLPEGAGEWELRRMAEAAGYPCGLWVSLRSPFLVLPEVGRASGLRPQASGQKPKQHPDQNSNANPSANPNANANQNSNQNPNPKQKPKVEKLPSGDARFEQVEAALDGKFRQNLRRRRRRLAEQGEVKYVLLDGKDAKALDEGLADFFTIEASGWKGEGGTAIAQRPELVGFYTQVARDAARRGALALGFLELGGKRIAAHLSLVHAGRHFLLKLGYDESLNQFSPGQQLVSDAIRDACARGLREFDFLGPCMDWKLDWESKLRAHTWLTIFRPTQAGKLVREARFTLWPILRKLFEKES